MNWKIAQAKQQLSKVVRLAQTEPQILQNRDEAVAAVVSAADFARFQEWQRLSSNALSQAFERIREIAKDEDWTLVVPARTDRDNPFSALTDGERQPKKAGSRRARSAGK